MKVIKSILMASVVSAIAFSGSASASEKKTLPKSSSEPLANDKTSSVHGTDPDAEAKTGKHPARKKKAGSKIRIGGLGFIAMGMKDAPSPGVYGFGGSAGYRILRNIELEASLTSFGYVLDYADVNTTLTISDMAINGDGIYRLPLSSLIALRVRGGAGMNIIKVVTTGDLATDPSFAAGSVNSFAINLGGGLEMNFGRFFIAAEVRKPTLLTKVATMGGISMLLCGEAGMRF